MSNILIADNSEDLLEMLSISFKRTSFSVITANTEVSFYETLQKIVPSIIVLDTHMGNNDGREICKKLKLNTQFKNTHIIVMSVNPLLLENYTDYLADDVLEKPFSILQLSTKIKIILSKRRLNTVSSPLAPITSYIYA